MRVFATGATRDTNETKPDYKGFLSPRAIRRFGQYMLKHQIQADGTRRTSDNWKKGIPIEAYTESLIRHVADFHYAIEAEAWVEADELACAIYFNVQGYLHERSKQIEIAPAPTLAGRRSGRRPRPGRAPRRG